MSSDFRKAEMTSVPITLILLLAVFGALIAAGIPVVLAGTVVISTISLLAALGRWLPIGSATSQVVLILGMAVRRRLLAVLPAPGARGAGGGEILR